MTQEDKQLLLVDLYGRLPYEVKVNVTSKASNNRIVHLTEGNVCHLIDEWWVECKPYLFPMSSMTDEQKTEWDYIDYYADHHEAVDWLNKNHFDYRGLIEKGLAIDATGLNIY